MEVSRMSLELRLYHSLSILDKNNATMDAKGDTGTLHISDHTALDASHKHCQTLCYDHYLR